jgi:hypothetical protein
MPVRAATSRSTRRKTPNAARSCARRPKTGRRARGGGKRRGLESDAAATSRAAAQAWRPVWRYFLGGDLVPALAGAAGCGAGPICGLTVLPFAFSAAT